MLSAAFCVSRSFAFLLPDLADHEPQAVLCLGFVARVIGEADAARPVEAQEVVAGAAVGDADAPALEGFAAVVLAVEGEALALAVLLIRRCMISKQIAESDRYLLKSDKGNADKIRPPHIERCGGLSVKKSYREEDSLRTAILFGRRILQRQNLRTRQAARLLDHLKGNI